MIKEKIPGIKKFLVSKKAKRIIATVVITFIVLMFFIWLGVGMYVSVPEENRGELWPVFGMYTVFPALIFFFGVRRVLDVINNDEDDKNDYVTEEEE
jgi:ABC-type anion transport system duplicated permease subunit